MFDGSLEGPAGDERVVELEARKLSFNCWQYCIPCPLKGPSSVTYIKPAFKWSGIGGNGTSKPFCPCWTFVLQAANSCFWRPELRIQLRLLGSLYNRLSVELGKIPYRDFLHLPVVKENLDRSVFFRDKDNRCDPFYPGLFDDLGR